MEKNEEEKNISIKSTFSNLIKEEIPEMSQEEAIKNYRENDTIAPIKKSKKDGESDDNVEESEHIKRIKQELLASLERVKQLAKKIYSEEKSKSNLKVKEKVGKQQSGKGISKKIETSEKESRKEEIDKER